MKKHLHHLLRQSGLCIDSPSLLDWIVHKDWRQTLFFRFLRLRFSPAILLTATKPGSPLEKRGRLFSLAISYLNVGRTYKTTGMNRTTLADEAIRSHALHFTSVRLLDVGASDGSSSMDLIQKLPNLKEYIPADLHPLLHRKGCFPIQIFFDGEHRFLGIKLLWLYLNLGGFGPVCGWRTQPISTLNPTLTEQANVVPPLSFDLFTDTLQEPADIIKCANLLNQEYFSDTELCDGVENLIRSLTPEGVLVVSQNNARFRNGEAVVVLQRGTQGVSVTEKQGNHPVAALFVTSEAAP